MSDITEKRELGIQSLSLVLKKEKNVLILEEYIYQLAEDHGHDYTTVLYQVIGDIFSGKKLGEIVSHTKSNKVIWDHPDYEQYRKELDEQDQFSRNPIEIVEGVEKCKKCKSVRVYSYSIQQRSADEGMTTYCSCMACGTRWSHRG